MELPKLRPIEVRQVNLNGQKLVCLQDPLGFSSEALFITPEATLVLSLMDGSNTVDDIQRSIENRFNMSVSLSDINALIGQLDKRLYLDNEAFRKRRDKILDDFRTASVRESSHAGLSYPSDKDELKGWLNKYFLSAREKLGDGKDFNKDSKGDLGKTKAIISPHIDYPRGGASYAAAYGQISDIDPATTFIILATSHYATVDNPFILSKKSFTTPFGEMPSDIEAIEDIETALDWDIFDGEIAHLKEHSIEFQIVFIQYLFGLHTGIKIIPILCNSFCQMVEEGVSPSENDKVSAFISALKNTVSDKGDKAFVIVSGDLAHVGPKFGDNDRVNETSLSWIRERDFNSLSFVENGDAEGFYRSIEEEKDTRKICGLSPIYSLLSIMDGAYGKILDYDQAIEEDTGSVVSFASMGFYAT